MDKYLESLVVKSNEINDNSIATDPVEMREEVEEPEVAEPVEKPDSAEVEEAEEPKVAEPVEGINSDSTNASQPAEPAASSTNDPMGHVSVIDIRVYNTPYPNGPFRIFSGNVIIHSRVENMTLIEFMKPGFGLVKGFTPDLK